LIGLASNSGDTVLDPFCGAGTSMVSAQNLGRKWLACDISRDSVATSIARLERLGLQVSADFKVGDETTLKDDGEVIPFYYAPVVVPQDIDVKPLIITEGKTDWKHLKAAFDRIKQQGYWKDFAIEFREDEEEMGFDVLDKLCTNLAKISHPRKIIC